MLLYEISGSEMDMVLEKIMIQGFLLVYSMTSKLTFDHLENIKAQIDRVKEAKQPIPVLLLANKCDRTHEIEVSREEGMALAKKWDILYLETSAKTGVNIERAFVELVGKIRAFDSDKSTKTVKKSKCLIL